jgi:hypothetical protein
MRIFLVAVCLAVIAGGVGALAGCGPEEKYCAKENLSCAQAKIDMDQQAAAAAAQAAAQADAGDPNAKETNILGSP